MEKPKFGIRIWSGLVHYYRFWGFAPRTKYISRDPNLGVASSWVGICKCNMGNGIKVSYWIADDNECDDVCPWGQASIGMPGQCTQRSAAATEDVIRADGMMVSCNFQIWEGGCGNSETCRNWSFEINKWNHFYACQNYFRREVYIRPKCVIFFHWKLRSWRSIL